MYPTLSDAIWTHSSLQSQEGKIQQSTGKSSCNNPRAQSCEVLSTLSHGRILEGNCPPIVPGAVHVLVRGTDGVAAFASSGLWSQQDTHPAAASCQAPAQR